MRHPLLALLLSLLAAPLWAEEYDFPHARIRHLEPGVSQQRASEESAEEAFVNAPFLPGDRIWTNGHGRVEFQFRDGAILRLDSRSKLDYVAQEGGRGQERLVLKLWSGGAFLRAHENADAEFQVETPAAVVETRDRGVYRIDVADGETRLSVLEGEASLEARGRAVRLAAGERSYARQGETPEEAQAFDREDGDDFARWDGDREERRAYAGPSRRYLPEEIGAYADDLDRSGSWYYEAEVGHVWRPYVTSGWSPYADGHWVWTSYGWTWVAYEPWGWAPFHYGRWGFSSAGWYWIPGAVWSPAWVSWAVGGDYVGWCPLGYRNRPVVLSEFSRYRGNAVPRSGVAGLTNNSGAWIYARRGDLSARNLAQRRVVLDAAQVAAVRVAESPRLRPDRDFRMVDTPVAHSAVPRNVRTKPTPGDTVPELRSDPSTVIPAPSARRRREDGSWPHWEQDQGAAPTRRPAEHPTDVRRGRPAAPSEGDPPAARPRGRESHPTELRSSPRRDPVEEARPRREGPPPSRDDHDVLRQVFRPVNPEGRRPRPETSRPQDAGDRPSPRYQPEPRPAAVPHDEPRRAAPRYEPRSAPPARSEPRTEPRSAPPPRSEPAHASPRTEPQHAAPRAEPRPTPAPHRDR